ncbi:MAG: hypothetical protein IRY97_00650 [Thermomicrobiaceae bacterium]|nr:hypothetical protein [Thermomicrobiaceae bacterium]
MRLRRIWLGLLLLALPACTVSREPISPQAAANSNGGAATATSHPQLFADSFESGDLSRWATASGLEVQQQEVATGSHAARGTSTGKATYAIVTLQRAEMDLYARVKFKILDQGANSAYLLRFRTAGNDAVLGVYVSSTGKLGYRNDVRGKSNTSGTVVSAQAWHEVQVHVVVGGAAGRVEIWLDGDQVEALSHPDDFGSDGIGRVQLGENAPNRSYDIAFDDVAVDTAFIAS